MVGHANTLLCATPTLPGVPIQFDKGFEDASYKLFELDDDVLQELTQSGGSLHIKGAPEDEALLCTSTNTFVLRLAESSNNMLLLPTQVPRDAPSDAADAEPLLAVAQVMSHFELKKAAPRTARLRPMLAAFPWVAEEQREESGDCEEGTVEDEGAAEDEGGEGRRGEDAGRRAAKRARRGGRPRYEELQHGVQCSEAELRVALQRARALEIDGEWAVLEAQYERDVTECILSLLVEREWAHASLPVAECEQLCLEQFPDFSAIAVRHCLRSLSTAASAPWDEWQQALEASTLQLDAGAVCRFRASVLLVQIEAWPEADFMEAWRDGVPAPMLPERKQLDGLAVAMDGQVQSLPLEVLPTSPSARFAALFLVKRQWRLDELVPYVDEFVPPGESHEKFVLVFARPVVADDKSTTYVVRFAEGAPTYTNPYSMN
ncbi:hypothetical protein AB1Y20_020954 [Prymnesium parvum]|uniref:Sister chromatid cohesion protein DCC1 n=1 Tax=Prymnesium parvum TaxID=97485 RepID=A0AB34JI71_PRYPA